MKIDQKILNEINRYHKINNYIREQTEPPPPPLPGDELDPAAGAMPNAPVTPPGEVSPIPPTEPGGTDPLSTTEPEIIDVNMDDDVTAIDDKGGSEESVDDTGNSEELDITDLVTSQKSMESKQSEYFDNLFGQLNKLETKLTEMDKIFDKLTAMETKIEKYREKTPEEKLELRTYDSYPFNQKLSDFFDDKQQDMQKSGKNEYILTSDDVVDINPDEVKNTFNQDYEEDEGFDVKF
jgi:hypothetical protein